MKLYAAVIAVTLQITLIASTLAAENTVLGLNSAELGDKVTKDFDLTQFIKKPAERKPANNIATKPVRLIKERPQDLPALVAALHALDLKRKEKGLAPIEIDCEDPLMSNTCHVKVGFRSCDVRSTEGQWVCGYEIGKADNTTGIIKFEPGAVTVKQFKESKSEAVLVKAARTDMKSVAAARKISSDVSIKKNKSTLRSVAVK